MIARRRRDVVDHAEISFQCPDTGCPMRATYNNGRMEVEAFPDDDWRDPPNPERHAEWVAESEAWARTMTRDTCFGIGDFNRQLLTAGVGREDLWYDEWFDDDWVDSRHKLIDDVMCDVCLTDDRNAGYVLIRKNTLPGWERHPAIVLCSECDLANKTPWDEEEA